MTLELHNFIWEQQMLIQVESQPHHLAGVLTEVRQILDETDCDWDEIFSAYYECEEDGTTTFYEAESADAGSPGIWTYVVYDCAAGEEKVVTNVNIDTLKPALHLEKMVTS